MTRGLLLKSFRCLVGMAHEDIRSTHGRTDPIGIWTGYQAEIPLASALPTRLACSSMETIQFAAIQWPEVFLILGVLAIGALLFGLLIYTVIRLSRK